MCSAARAMLVPCMSGTALFSWQPTSSRPCCLAVSDRWCVLSTVWGFCSALLILCVKSVKIIPVASNSSTLISVFRSFYAAGKLLFLNTSMLHVWFRNTIAKLRTEPGISCIHICPLQYARERVQSIVHKKFFQNYRCSLFLMVAEESRMLILTSLCNV